MNNGISPTTIILIILGAIAVASLIGLFIAKPKKNKAGNPSGR